MLTRSLKFHAHLAKSPSHRRKENCELRWPDCVIDFDTNCLHLVPASSYNRCLGVETCHNCCTTRSRINFHFLKNHGNCLYQCWSASSIWYAIQSSVGKFPRECGLEVAICKTESSQKKNEVSIVEHTWSWFHSSYGSLEYLIGCQDSHQKRRRYVHLFVKCYRGIKILASRHSRGNISRSVRRERETKNWNDIGESANILVV